MNQTSLNSQERLDLKKLIKHQGSDYEDNTEGIRKLKHSSLIQSDLIKMETIKRQNKEIIKTDSESILEKCKEECPFLYNSYTDIFNRLWKDELNLYIMGQALFTLKQIEDGTIDQQEGSVLMGKLFYELFVDSALKRSDAIDKEQGIQTSLYEGEQINWKQYKKGI
jgi:hypothetical protein